MIQKKEKGNMNQNMVCEDIRGKVEIWLSGLSAAERIALINKYSEKAKDIYYIYDIDDYVDVLNKLLSLKSSTEALINCYVHGDPVVNRPGYKLNEFLNDAMVSLVR
jgi:hypothetical protein